MQSGRRIGSILGIPLQIDPSWFIILFLVTLSYGLESAWQQTWGLLAWVMGLGLALLLFSSVLLHELGHSVVAQRQGITVNSITLFLFGGIAAIDRESSTPGQAFQVAIAGPLVSFALYLLLSGLNLVPTLPLALRVVLAEVARINLVLTLFNLIPGLPLDGGQVMKAAVWKLTGSRLQGVRWAARSGQILGWSAIVFGLALVLGYGVVSGLWIAAIGWFAVRNAANYTQVTNMQEAIKALTVGDALGREFKVVNGKMTLRQFADVYLLDATDHPVYFAASDGRYRGMVSVDTLRTTERSQWDWQTLDAIAQPLLSLPFVRETTPLVEAIETLETLSQPRLTVLSPADAVAGTLDRGDVVQAIAQRLGLAVSADTIARIKQEGVYPAGLQIPALAKTATD